MKFSELGDQAPRIVSIPKFTSSSGAEAMALAALAGIFLDPWQEFCLFNMLGERPDGSWAATSCGICVPRQQGKSELLVTRMLAGLFLLKEDLQIYTSYQFDSATEIFRRLCNVIDAAPELRKQVKLSRGQVGQKSHGSEGVELLPKYGGRRVRFKARASGGGRGFTADCLYLDEAMILSDEFMAASQYSVSAVPNPQIIYAGSAVNEADSKHDGLVFSRIRERAMRGGDKTLFYAEWSVDRKEYVSNPNIASNPKYWKQANPALDIRLSREIVEEECKGGELQFAVERLGIGLWPKTDGSADKLILPAEWSAGVDKTSKMAGRLVLAFDTTPDHAHGCVAVAGERSDGLHHIEVVKYARDTRWMPQMLLDLQSKYNVGSIIFDSAGPATALLPELQTLGVKTTPIARAELAQGCGLLLDGVKNQSIRHGGQPELAQAIDGVGIQAADRGAWVWSRRNSSGDVCPLISVTLALWGVIALGHGTPQIINLNEVAARKTTANPESEGVGPFNQRTVSLSAR